MRFTKMHGLGNDYLYVNCFEEAVADPAAVARVISDRHRGVGSDGLILIGPAEGADVRMEIYNADGSRAALCGNGLRCVAKYAYERGVCRKRLIRVATDSGIRLAECFPENGVVSRVRVVMGTAEYAPRGLPAFTGRSTVVDESFQANNRRLRGTFVSIGNPHLVVFVREWDEIDLATDGPVLETHERFPDRINVHFARVDSPGEITMVSWERGSGPTQACGTGACAVADAAFTHNLTSFPTSVHLPGGDLLIERAGDLDRRAWVRSHGIDVRDPRYGLGDDAGLLMTGPAEEVFSGEWVG